MTISSQASQTVIAGNGSNTSFSFNFIGVMASDLVVIYTDSNGVQTTLNPSQYNVIINQPATGSLWGYGGTITYPINGTPIPTGTTLTIKRVIPLTQLTSISNQTQFYPQVMESALDILCLEIQQIANRTGQYLGSWVTNYSYNYGDIVQDGANGTNTQNYYMCVVSNTSLSWTNDLANGYWTLFINIKQISDYATASANSATASATSASQSANSASQSALSATASANSATASVTSASQSSLYASNALSSENNANASALTATQQATLSQNYANASNQSAQLAQLSAQQLPNGDLIGDGNAPIWNATTQSWVSSTYMTHALPYQYFILGDINNIGNPVNFEDAVTQSNSVTNIISGTQAIVPVTNIISGTQPIVPVTNIISGTQPIVPVTNIISGTQPIVPVTNIISGTQAIVPVTNIISGTQAIVPVTNIISGTQAIVLNSNSTGTTQASTDNSNKLATTAFVKSAGGSGGGFNPNGNYAVIDLPEKVVYINTSPYFIYVELVDIYTTYGINPPVNINLNFYLNNSKFPFIPTIIEPNTLFYYIPDIGCIGCNPVIVNFCTMAIYR